MVLAGHFDGDLPLFVRRNATDGGGEYITHTKILGTQTLIAPSIGSNELRGHCIVTLYPLIPLQSEELNRTAYDFPWYRYRKNVRQIIQMMMLRAQKPSRVDVPFFEASVVTFSTVIDWTWF